MNINKVMKHFGMLIFTAGLLLSFTNIFDFRAFMLILGSSLYTAVVDTHRGIDTFVIQNASKALAKARGE